MCDKFRIHHDAPVIYPLVHAVQFLLPVRYGKLRELIPDLLFHIHVTDTVGLEQLPLLRLIRWKVSCPAAV